MTEIAVRAYTERQKQEKPRQFTEKSYEFDRILVFDTETTTDTFQNLKFGYFEIYQHGMLEHRAIFYDSKTVPSKENTILHKCCNENNIELISVEAFRKIFLIEIYDLRTLCCGFNLGFDLKRIATHIGIGRRSHKEGFSLKFTNNLHYPRLHITHISNTLSFFEWGNTFSKSKRFKGNFIDLRATTNALTDQKYSLESACKAFNTEYKKQKAKQHGKITLKYIKYCIWDVKATYSLYQNVLKEFKKYDLDIPITKAYTPASIGKQILKKIGVKSFFTKNPKFPKEIIGHTMSGYFGGRTDCKIRKTPTKVNLLDFLSMYPTVCTLQELWKFVTAKKILHVENTTEISEFLDSITIEDIKNPDLWKRLPGMALVKPDCDILPIRSKFGAKYAWNIGICQITSTPLWYSIADLVASKILTGKTPKILKAYSFVPEGVQPNLKDIDLFGIKINPYTQDLFKELIQYRQKLKDKRDLSVKSTPDHSYYDRLQQIIKIIANATSYGIFVEIKSFNETKETPIDVYGLTQFTNNKTKVEESGFIFNPMIAVSITSASRLLLATTEALLSKHNATYAYCDTDSMAIPPCHTKEIQSFFSKLNPYNFDAEIFKIERENVWFYGISAKRYCLYTIDKKGNIVIDSEKYSAHGLGHLLDPFKNNPDDESEWHKEIWQDILDLEYQKISRESLIEKYENKYAIQQLSISTPSIYSRVEKMNQGKDWHHQIKPGNFVLVGFSNMQNEATSEPIKPFAPFQNPAKKAVYLRCVDYNEPSHTIQGQQYWKTLADWFFEYLNHPENKFDGNTGVLNRKLLTISNVIHIGKESNDLEREPFELDGQSYVLYQDDSEIDRILLENKDKILSLKPKDVKPFGISRQTLWNVKTKLTSNQLNSISEKVKMIFLRVLSFE